MADFKKRLGIGAPCLSATGVPRSFASSDARAEAS